MAGRRFHGVSRRSTRETQWGFLTPITFTLTASGGTIGSSLNAAALALRPFTIIRTHLALHLSSDQIIATEDQVAAYGIAIVSDQASAAGVAAVPTPDTDAGSDLWFVHKYMHNRFGFADATGFARIGTSYTIDSKAMRRVEEGQDMVTVAEVDTATSSGLQLMVAGRFLIKLH